MFKIFKISLLIIALEMSHATFAEVVLDGTLGTPGALTGPEFAIEAHLGEQVGNNLFHSFEIFNLNQHEIATFSGPETINNIISRVTGDKISNINGLLRSTIPDADMYLINPAGIIFGEHGSLDVKGSFYASTANYLLLGQNGRFDASHPENSLLTIAPPSAFGFLDESPAGIEEYGFLTVDEGKSISLIGGDLTLQDIDIIAPGGQVNLVSVASLGEVPIDPANISNNAFEQFGTITMTDTTSINDRNTNIYVSGEGGGLVYILGGQIFMENVYVFAETKSAKNGQGIVIKAKENINIKASELSSKTTSSGEGGNIDITTPNLTLEGDALIEADTQGLGNAGNILLHLDTLTLKSGAQVNVNSGNFFKRKTGQGGMLKIIANKNILITGQSKSSSALLSNTFGRNEGGSIDVQTPLLEVQGKGSIQAGTEFDNGKAGNITLHVDRLNISQGGSITTQTLGNGEGGEIDIQAQKISIADKGIITASSSGTGNAGNIKITSPGYLHLTNSEITTSVSANNGNGGNITLDPEFIILDNSYIKANAFEGKGGVINITTTGIYNLSGEPIKDIITAKSEVEGLDGLVTINSPDIDISKSLTQILPKTFLDAASLLRKQCATRSGLNLSHLSIIRGDVVPKDPMDLRNHSMQLAAPGFKPCHAYGKPPS